MRMRSFLLAATALASALALFPAAAAADPPARSGYGYGYHGEDASDDFWEDRDDDDDDRGRGQGRDRHRDRDRDRGRDDDAYRRGYEDAQRERYAYGERVGYGDRRGHDSYGDSGGFGGWDSRAYNGYSYGGAWYWGEPPRDRWRDCRPGYRRLVRGERLPRGYVVIPVDDWRRNGLYAPPRGHSWSRDDSGTYFLLGLATGVILDSVLRGY